MPKAYGNSHKRQTRPDTGPRRVRGPYALGGCLTCRRRHVKCDQVKPVCLTCQACGETCDGFSDDLCWVGASSSSKRESPADPSQGSRRHLYTDDLIFWADNRISDWDGYIVWDDLFTLDIENTPWMPSATGYTDRGLLESAPDFQTPTDLGYSRTARISHTESYMSMNTLPLMPSFKDELGAVDWHSTDITFLLRNFNSVVMPRMASVPLAKKFAWGPMHHELAVQTLAEVTFLKKPEVNEAKLANLHSWLMLANGKVQWVTSNQAEARRFQLEAERLVRFRGLSKRNISRRIRLLHHAYTWNRIVGESTYVLHDYGTFQHAISASVGEPATSDGAEANIMANESSSHDTQENTRLDDFLRIGHRFEEVGSHLEGQKDAQAGTEDIHLEDPRTSVEDGFHVIYGIPEQWLSLLSRTTRLANWLDATEIPQRLSNNRLVEILERRAQSLEDAICSFVESRNLSASIDANDPPNVCMFRCLTAALLIFFYRRIRNVHPLVLQVYVDQIIRGLEIFDDSLARHGQAGPGSAWAAFIAGCEAMGESRREKLRQWMDRAFDSYAAILIQYVKGLRDLALHGTLKQAGLPPLTPKPHPQLRHAARGFFCNQAKAKAIESRLMVLPGCYTCKIRKVRCGSPRDGGHATLSACANCERLGLPCQWNKPAEGENYTPPPKRRRTVGNRRRGQDGDASPSPLPQQILQEGSNEPAESIQSADAAEFEPQAFTDLTDLQLDLPEEFDFDAGLGVEPNLFWSGEGVDFIPLPLIESTPMLFQTTADNYLQVEMPPVAQLPCFSPDTDQDPLGQDTDISAFSITGNVDTRRLIQHYLEVMNGYSKVTDHGTNNNNLFIAAFSKSLFFMPLYYAILSFSASHLSLQDPSLAGTACRLENLAEEHFNRAFQDYTAKVEGLLSALFVRVKRVHVMGESVSSFLRLISIATEIIFSKQGREALETPSELSGRIVLRLATLDARASCYRLGGGLLVRRLREIPSLSFIFKFEDNESSSTSAFVHLLRADILRMRVGQLDLRVHEHKGSVELDEVEMLQADIKTLIHRWEQHLSKYTKEGATVSALPAGVYGCYTVLGALHSALLYLHSVYVSNGFLPRYIMEADFS
ncbi:fungal-specific transcription factor domain-containing protein [Fusarium oxysporum Fo47]|uniref:fungal-specific transcription factor domain-containing protein n=1 Tax=Fusarium oxysporum Fo47 TaxID=660027 RepID=UPI002869E8D8|nr:fungal-specific transcription factor domain-containing protein [Fusarium oxysporum Fo47]QKD60094.2 fungal-specific transcription factor domain-domain-containing protein [Fusarium oxysporum Fo47]